MGGADGKAKFVFGEPSPMPERPNEKYPYLLLTGRGSASQWHTQTRTSKSPILKRLYSDELRLDIHPADARPLHKKTFSLESGLCLSGEDHTVKVLPVRVIDGQVQLLPPPIEQLDALLATDLHCVTACRPAAELAAV